MCKKWSKVDFYIFKSSPEKPANQHLFLIIICRYYSIKVLKSRITRGFQPLRIKGKCSPSFCGSQEIYEVVSATGIEEQSTVSPALEPGVLLAVVEVLAPPCYRYVYFPKKGREGGYKYNRLS